MSAVWLLFAFCGTVSIFCSLMILDYDFAHLIELSFVVVSMFAFAFGLMCACVCGETHIYQAA